MTDKTPWPACDAITTKEPQPGDNLQDVLNETIAAVRELILRVEAVEIIQRVQTLGRK